MPDETVFFRHERITRHDRLGAPDRGEQLYLSRFIVFKCRWFGVMLHHFFSSDDECLHDHPWPFMSIILWGGYWESVGHSWSKLFRCWLPGTVTRTWHPPGSILVRGSGHAHRIEIDPARPNVWSLVLTGPRKRMWGFFTPVGWLPANLYDHARHRCTEEEAHATHS